MRKLPMAVEYVAWVVVVWSVVAMVQALWAYEPPDASSPVEAVRNPDNFPAIANGTFAILFFIWGVNIAKGRDWARWLYVVTCLVASGLQVVLLHEHLYGVKWYYVVLACMAHILNILLLFLPSSNSYFRAPKERHL